MSADEKHYSIHKAAAIIIQDRKILVERSKGKEFFVSPGGKLDKGETPEQALVRELQEEFRITVLEKDVHLFGIYYADAANSPDKRMRMDVFMVGKWKGEITPDNEVEEVMWLGSDIPANLPLASIFKKEVIPQLTKDGLID